MITAEPTAGLDLRAPRTLEEAGLSRDLITQLVLKTLHFSGELSGSELSRRLGLPFRTGGSLCASKIPDAQAAYESVFSLWATTMGHANLVMHAAGWMEGGLTASFEKMVLDADLLQMVAEFLQPVEVSEATLALVLPRSTWLRKLSLNSARSAMLFNVARRRWRMARNRSPTLISAGLSAGAATGWSLATGI